MHLPSMSSLPTLPSLPPCASTEIRSHELTGDCADAMKPWILAATIAGSSLAFLIAGGINVALPAVQRSLGASVAEVQWILNGYLLALASLTIPMGAAGDRVGRGVMFRWGLAVFAAGSLACAVAPGVWSLIAARLLQGVGAAMLVPNSLALLAAAFPANERGAAIGTWGAASALMSAAGPAGAGGLAEVLGWRAVFAVFVPLTLLTLAAAFYVVPMSIDADAGPVDVGGTVLSSLGLAAIVFGLIDAGEAGWDSPRVIAALLLGPVLLVAFLILEHRKERTEHAPMVPPSLFRDRTFSGTNLLTLLLYFGMSGAFFIIPFNLIQLRGLPVWQVGLGFLPFSLTMAALGRKSGEIADRLGPKPQLVAGSAVTAAAFGLLAWPGLGGGYWTAVFPGMLGLGVGMAVMSSPLTTAVMGSVPPNRTGVASGVNNTIARIATLLAIAILGVVMASVFEAELPETMHAAADEADLGHDEMPKAAMDPDPFAIDATLPPELLRGRHLAFLHGYRIMMVTSAGLAVVAMLVASLMIPGRTASD